MKPKDSPSYARGKVKRKHGNKNKQKKKNSCIKMVNTPDAEDSTANPFESSQIEVSTQLNRFHEATIDHSSKDIFLSDVNIKIGNSDLLVGSQLKIESACRYGLVGRNGIGKSTLLKALGSNMFEGISSLLRILYVDQLEDQSESTTVLEAVLSADIEVIQLKQKLALLQESLKHDDKETSLKAIHQVNLNELTENVRAKKKIAEKRSGDRGQVARQILLEAEKELESEKKKSTDELAREYPNVFVHVHEMIQATTQKLEMHDVETAEPRAREILSG